MKLNEVYPEKSTESGWKNERTRCRRSWETAVLGGRDCGHWSRDWCSQCRLGRATQALYGVRPCPHPKTPSPLQKKEGWKLPPPVVGVSNRYPPLSFKGCIETRDPWIFDGWKLPPMGGVSNRYPLGWGGVGIGDFPQWGECDHPAPLKEWPKRPPLTRRVSQIDLPFPWRKVGSRNSANSKLSRLNFWSGCYCLPTSLSTRRLYSLIMSSA